MKTPSARLLDAARAATPDATTGVARSGAAVVTWYRTAGHRRYDVGTDAAMIRYGHSAEVTPYLEAILAGCVTREGCDAWIADAPARAAAVSS